MVRILKALLSIISLLQSVDTAQNAEKIQKKKQVKVEIKYWLFREDENNKFNQREAIAVVIKNYIGCTEQFPSHSGNSFFRYQYLTAII